MKLRTTVIASLLFACAAASAGADPITGTLFFTTFAGGQNVWKVDFDFDGTTFMLGAQTNIASTPGADGIVFDPVSGHLLVGGQGPLVHKVDPSAVNSFVSVTSGIPNAFHLSVDPDGETVWAAGIPGDLGEVPLDPFAPGTFRNVTGEDTVVDTLAWVPNGPGGFTTWYTSSGSGGFGCIGTINMATFVTDRKTCLPASHGMSFDPLTGHLILMGDGHLTQFDPATETIVGDLTFPGLNFDQGAVDGKGHIFAATNNGFLVFVDYAATGDIDTFSFLDDPFLANALDDIAPLSGPGGQPSVPEPGTTALLGLGALAFGARRRLWRKPLKNEFKRG